MITDQQLSDWATQRTADGAADPGIADWQRTNAALPLGSSIPKWQAMGYPSEAAYNGAYGGISSGSGAPTSSAPSTTPGTNPLATYTGYDDSTAFGHYLNTHPDQGDNWAQLEAQLKNYGLNTPDIIALAHDSMIQGLSNNEAIQRVRETPTYKTRFAAIVQRQQAGLPPISEADVVNTERAYSQVMAQAGLPQGFYDSPDDFTNLLSRDVSPTELKDRVINGYQAAMQADPSVRNELARLYGVDLNHLAAYYIDPQTTQALLQKQLTSAQMGAAAQRSGYGTLNITQAEHLAGLGITDAQASQGFGQLGLQQGLLTQNAGEGNSISGDTAFAATFDNNADAQRQLTRRREERQAAFQGGGNFADPNRQGLTGAGTSNQ